MNKYSLNRILELKKEVESLPNEILSELNYEIYVSSSNDEDKAEVYNDLSRIRENKDAIIRKLLGFFSANLEDDSVYYLRLSEITFRPKEGVFNTIHYKNNEAWRMDKEKLLKLLDILENEIREKMLIKNNTQNQNIFSSGLFWTIVPIVAAVSYFLGTYKAEYDKSEIEKQLVVINSKFLELRSQNKKLESKLKLLKNLSPKEGEKKKDIQ